MNDHDMLALFRIHVDRLFVTPPTTLEKLLHALFGMAGEVGELIDMVKKFWIYKKDFERKNAVEELGDLLFYMQAFMIHSEITWEEVINHNVEKLKVRYPAGYTDAAAQARARADKHVSNDPPSPSC